MRTEPGDTLLAVRDDQLPRLQRLFPGGIAADGRAGVYSVFSAATLRATPRVP